MKEATISQWFRQTAIALTSTAIAVFLTPSQAMGAETVIFTYGSLTQSIPLEEIQDFADTGNTSPSLAALLKLSKQNPFVIRWVLRQEFTANNKMIADLLNTAPGEYVLSQTSNVVGSEAERANVTALRGALITSASDNNLVSLMELLTNYPTPKVYVNGRILLRLRKNLNQFVEGTSQYIKIPIPFSLPHH